nr:putative ribonuclease H-like domain-containing protein [Tanacetum cinerariifolium]
ATRASSTNYVNTVSTPVNTASTPVKTGSLSRNQNGVAKRKNRTLIEAARTMLADSFLPNIFWAEAVSTVYYVLNREIGKKEEDSKALITVDTLVDWTDHDGKSDGFIASKEFGMIVGCDTKDAIEEGAAKIYNLICGADTEKASTASDAEEFALMGVTSEIKLDNHLVQAEKWRNSSKNLFRLIYSFMSVRTKVGLGFNNCIRENELGWDDSAFSVFTTNSEDVEGRPLFHRFAKADSMKVVPPPLSGEYTSLSDHNDLDESHMSYGTKSSTSSDSKSVSNDFVSCDDSDKSLKVNTNNFASGDSSVKSSKPKLNDSTSCASTSSVSTSENEAEIESNVGTPIQ